MNLAVVYSLALLLLGLGSQVAHSEMITILDDGNASTSSSGTWAVHYDESAYGTRCLHSTTPSTYRWSATVPEAGEYNVYIWWPRHENATENAAVTIAHAGGRRTVWINQGTDGARWYWLGAYNFTPQAAVSVTLSSQGPKITCADAVMLLAQELLAHRNVGNSLDHFFLCSYRLDDQDATNIAGKYGFIVSSLEEASVASVVKLINPDSKIIYYDNALTHGEQDYLYDISSGKKIVHDTWGWYLHDISQASYRTSLATKIASDLVAYGQFDGVFLDDCRYAIEPSEFHQEGTNVDPVLAPDLITGWRSYMVELLSEIKAAIGAHLLITNSGWFSTEFLPYVDGIMDENFAHAGWDPYDVFLGLSSWENHLKALIRVAEGGKYYLAQSGVATGATAEQERKLAMYSYCSFLMGVPANNRYARHYFCGAPAYQGYEWYDHWGYDLGDPLGNSTKISGADAYVREFSKGIVFVNPGDRDLALPVEGEYYDQEGNVISAVNLGSHQGVMLFRIEQDTERPAAPSGLRIVDIQQE
jgi:hypothetical protein